MLLGFVQKDAFSAAPAYGHDYEGTPCTRPKEATNSGYERNGVYPSPNHLPTTKSKNFSCKRSVEINALKKVEET